MRVGRPRQEITAFGNRHGFRPVQLGPIPRAPRVRLHLKPLGHPECVSEGLGGKVSITIDYCVLGPSGIGAEPVNRFRTPDPVQRILRPNKEPAEIGKRGGSPWFSPVVVRVP